MYMCGLTHVVHCWLQVLNRGAFGGGGGGGALGRHTPTPFAVFVPSPQVLYVNVCTVGTLCVLMECTYSSSMDVQGCNLEDFASHPAPIISWNPICAHT